MADKILIKDLTEEELKELQMRLTLRIANDKTFLLIKTLREAKRRMKAQELCDILEIEPRMLRKHKKYLEMLGYKLDITLGNNGGYLLVEESFSAEELAEIQNCIRPELFEKLEKIINRV